jgi:hypothetical protein
MHNRLRFFDPRHRSAILSTLAALGVAIALLSTPSTAGARPAAPSVALPLVAYEYVPPGSTLSRFGVGSSRTYDVRDYPIVGLGAGWYWDWEARPEAARPGDVEYYPTIRLKQTGPAEFSYVPNDATIAATARANPGTVWFIGNEPDCIHQDDLVPEVYAAAYHHLYTLIKGLDPTALIAAGQIVQPTALRLQYLDRVLAAYQAAHGVPLPADVWAIHAYPLNEQLGIWGAGIPAGIDATEGLVLEWGDGTTILDTELFRSFLHSFRGWMAERGYRNCPLLVTEFGVLAGVEWGASFEPASVNAYMDATHNILMAETSSDFGNPNDGFRLVQRWAWYRLSGREGENDAGTLAGWLYDADSRLRNPSGDNYARYTRPLERTVNLRPVSVNAEAVGSGSTREVYLTAAIVNNGSITASAVSVRFMRGDTQIGTDQVIPRLAGGAVPRLVRLRWPSPPTGSQEITVLVDPLHTVAETDEADNTLRRSVLIPSP